MSMKNQKDHKLTWQEQLQKWQENREKVVEMSEEGWNNAQIGRKLELSRERVRQILNKEQGR